MKSYLLLRDGHESGPFSVSELEFLPLREGDLIRKKEGKDWQPPFFFQELKGLVKSNGAGIDLNTSHQGNGPFPSSSSTYGENASKKEGSFFQLIAFYGKSLRDDRKREKKKVKTKPNYLKLAALAGGLVLFSLFLAKGINAFRSSGDNTAGSGKKGGINLKKGSPLQRALNYVAANLDSLRLEAARKKAKPKNLKKYITLSANDYEVGFFGGISNLKLAVTNKSDFKIDKVMVEVSFLKPNGEVVKKQRLTVKSIPANGKKSITVPSTSRGVKVKYRIISIQSKQHQAALLLQA